MSATVPSVGHRLPSRVSMRGIQLTREIERDNEVDCRVMAAVIEYLRSHH